MLVVYHYTNKEGLDAIKSSGKIKKSTNRAKDATHGEGNIGLSEPN